MKPRKGSACLFACAAVLSVIVPASPALAGAVQTEPQKGATSSPEDQGNPAAQAAFNSAKELGTPEAWNAFLANYPKGFYSDLARAYLQKQTDKAPALAPVAVAAPTTIQEVSCTEQSKLRSLSSDIRTKVTFVNTSEMYRSVLWIDFNGSPKDYGGIKPGGELTLDTFVTHPWMIATGPGDCLQIFMPAAGPSRVDLRRLAADGPLDAPSKQQRPPEKKERYEKQDRPEKEKPKKTTLVCGKNYKLRNGACVLQQNCGSNAYRSPEGDCYCNKNYSKRNGTCVWKQDKQGFEVAPWKKSGCKSWQSQCSKGNAKACGQYEANCQVN